MNCILMSEQLIQALVSSHFSCCFVQLTELVYLRQCIGYYFPRKYYLFNYITPQSPVPTLQSVYVIEFLLLPSFMPQMLVTPTILNVMLSVREQNGVASA